MATFEISDGVRRSKAASLLKIEEIWAYVDGSEAEQRVAVTSLLSPKATIEARGDKAVRWTNVLEGMAIEPDLFPPIIVHTGIEGTPIREVIVIEK